MTTKTEKKYWQKQKCKTLKVRGQFLHSRAKARVISSRKKSSFVCMIPVHAGTTCSTFHYLLSMRYVKEKLWFYKIYCRAPILQWDLIIAHPKHTLDLYHIAHPSYHIARIYQIALLTSYSPLFISHIAHALFIIYSAPIL